MLKKISRKASGAETKRAAKTARPAGTSITEINGNLDKYIDNILIHPEFENYFLKGGLCSKGKNV